MAKKSEKGKKRENDGSDGVMELVMDYVGKNPDSTPIRLR